VIETVGLAAIAYVGLHVIFLVIWTILLPPIHFILRFEWSRAAAIAGVLSLIITPVVAFWPLQTHAIRIDIPRPR